MLKFTSIFISLIQTLAANETREFDIVFKGNFNYSAFSPPKLELLTFFTAAPMQCDSDGCNLQLIRTPNSTLPPLINALEAYTIIEFPQLETSLSDGTSLKLLLITTYFFFVFSYMVYYWFLYLIFMLVIAIKNIKATYRLSKTSWQGDPCLPKNYPGKILNAVIQISPPHQKSFHCKGITKHSSYFKLI